MPRDKYGGAIVSYEYRQFRSKVCKEIAVVAAIVTQKMTLGRCGFGFYKNLTTVSYLFRQNRGVIVWQNMYISVQISRNLTNKIESILCDLYFKTNSRNNSWTF